MPPPTNDSQQLVAYIRDLVQSLEELAPRAIERGDTEEVHRSRVTTRRLRAALALVEPLVGTGRSRSLQQMLKRLRRRLGDVRDTDVMLAGLASIAGDDDVRAWARRLLRAQRNMLLKRSAKQISLSHVRRQLQHWKKIEAALGPASRELDRLLGRSLLKQSHEFTRQSRKAVGSRSQAAPPQWHALRIAGKHLRYTLEMAAAAGHPLPGGTARTFKRMQDALGEWHDSTVLIERLMHLAAEEHLALDRPVLMGELLQLLSSLQRLGEKRLAAFRALWKHRGEKLVAQLAALYKEAK